MLDIMRVVLALDSINVKMCQVMLASRLIGRWLASDEKNYSAISAADFEICDKESKTCATPL